ncbi:MAG: lysophospholipid acyltransferase family protein [Collinsella sp.]|nr:lysophospholipid acyltransferase family protein [Collinsella sp.]
MRLFTSSRDDYHDAAMSDYPLVFRALYSIVIGILFAFTKLMWRWEMEDPELLYPAGDDAGRIIICNHTSMAEVPCIIAHIWASGRRARPIYKSEFNKARIVGWAFSRFGGIPVERGTADMKSLRRAKKALQRGEDVLIFPEGTRIRTDDQPVEVHGGFALMASMAKARIAPIAVCGFRDITPAGKRIMRPMRCWMRAGAQVGAEDAPSDLKRRDQGRWVEEEAVRRMYELRDALRAEHPGRR